MTRLLVPTLSVVSAAALAVAASVGEAALVFVTAILVVLLAASWPTLLSLNDTVRGSSIVIAVSGLAALLLAWRFGTASDPLLPMTGVLAMSVAAAFVQQMLRRERSDVIESLTGTLSGQVLAVLASGWVLLPGTAVGPRGVAVAMFAVVVAVVVVNAPFDSSILGWAAFAAAALISGISAAVLADQAVLHSAFVGVAVAAVAAGTAVLFQSRPITNLRAAPAAAFAPVCAAGTVAYAVARLAGA